MLLFKGIQKTTLIDYPKQVACTLFLPKCNFKCPFCYNPLLVREKETGVTITGKDAFDFLLKRKNFLDAVCITGGEPLLHKGLQEFCKKVKQAGFLVKIDTNGSLPAVLSELIDGKAVDYIAMDIKGSRLRYNEAAGVEVDLGKIDESIKMIGESGLDYEFRLTAVPALHSEEDILGVGKWLKGSKLFSLQQFNPSVPLLDEKMQGSKTYSAEKLQQFAKQLKPFFESVQVRAL